MQQTQTPISTSESPSSGNPLVPQPDRHVRLRGPIPPEQVATVWPAVVPFVERALDHNPGRLLPVDLERFCSTGEMLLFIVWQALEERILASLIVEVMEYPRARVLSIIQGAGDEMERWIHLLPEMEDVARGLECTQIEVLGRSGWGRVLGWPETHRAFVKEIE